MKIELELSSKELALLSAAVCDYFHQVKENFSSSTYGALITDETILAARDLWKKVELATGVDKW